MIFRIRFASVGCACLLVLTLIILFAIDVHAGRVPMADQWPTIAYLLGSRKAESVEAAKGKTGLEMEEEYDSKSDTGSVLSVSVKICTPRRLS